MNSLGRRPKEKEADRVAVGAKGWWDSRTSSLALGLVRAVEATTTPVGVEGLFQRLALVVADKRSFALAMLVFNRFGEHAHLEQQIGRAAQVWRWAPAPLPMWQFMLRMEVFEGMAERLTRPNNVIEICHLLHSTKPRPYVAARPVSELLRAQTASRISPHWLGRLNDAGNLPTEPTPIMRRTPES